MASSVRRSCTVAELLATDGGSVKTGPFGTALKASEYSFEGVPLISVREIVRGGFHVDAKTPRISPTTVARLPEYVLDEDDVVFARKGSVERSARVGKAQAGWFLGSDGIRLRPPKTVDARYLAYCFQSQSAADWLVQQATGSTMASLNQGILLRFPLELPPLDEQKAISQVLGTIDDRIDLLRQTNATLEAIAQALFKAWFVDFKPVRAKMDGREPEGMDPATAALFPSEFDESELGLIPEGWPVCSLDSFASYLNGLALQKFPPESENEYLPVIKIAQLRAGNTTGADRASARLQPEYVVRDGDVLFSWSGSLEVEFWCGGDGALNQHLFKVTSTEVQKWLCYLATKHFLPGFRETAAHKATTMGHIQRKHLTEARLALPSSDLLDAVSPLMAGLLDRRVCNGLQARKLAALRDTLLPRLIAGKLRLPEAEAPAEEAAM